MSSNVSPTHFHSQTEDCAVSCNPLCSQLLHHQCSTAIQGLGLLHIDYPQKIGENTLNLIIIIKQFIQVSLAIRPYGLNKEKERKKSASLKIWRHVFGSCCSLFTSCLHHLLQLLLSLEYPTWSSRPNFLSYGWKPSLPLQNTAPSGRHYK